MKEGVIIPNTNAGVKLVNELLKLNVNVNWTFEEFSVKNKIFNAGTFLAFTKIPNLIKQLVEKYPLDVYELPPDVKVKCYSIRLPRIALYNGQGVDDMNAKRFRADTEYALSFLGFPYVLVTEQDIQNGILDNFNVLVVSAGDAFEMLNGWNTKFGWNKEPWRLPGSIKGLGKQGIAAIKKFLENGGAYIGIGCGGGALACEEVGGLADVSMLKVEVEKAVFRGQVRVYLKVAIPNSPIMFCVPDYVDQEEHVHKHVFPAYYFSDPLLLTYPGPIFKVGENVEVLATYHDVDVEAWTGFWQTPDIFRKDYPAIVLQRVGRGVVILFGIELDYNCTWLSTYKLLSNSLYTALKELPV